MNVDAKFFNTILASRKQQYIKKRTLYHKLRFIPIITSEINNLKSINAICYTSISSIKKNHMIISIDA